MNGNVISRRETRFRPLAVGVRDEGAMVHSDQTPYHGRLTVRLMAKWSGREKYDQSRRRFTASPQGQSLMLNPSYKKKLLANDDASDDMMRRSSPRTLTT
jgi:hypothetical protein